MVRIITSGYEFADFDLRGTICWVNLVGILFMALSVTCIGSLATIPEYFTETSDRTSVKIYSYDTLKSNNNNNYCKNHLYTD